MHMGIHYPYICTSVSTHSLLGQVLWWTILLQCARMYVYVYVHNDMFVEACALCKYIFRWLPRSKCFSGKTCFMCTIMHTLVCRVFKWNYEQHLYGHTFLPTDIRFAPANLALTPKTYWLSMGIASIIRLDNILILLSYSYQYLFLTN